MAKNIVNRVNRHLGRRLREARREIGLSTRAIAKMLPKRFTVSHSTIASYEAGVTVPAIDVLAAFAEIYKRPLTWFLENRESLSGFRFRNIKARVPLAEQRHFEALTGKWVDAYVKLERHLKTRGPANVLGFARWVSPQDLADTVRKAMLNLDDAQPIQNMVGVLESFSAWAMEIKPSFSADGAAARLGDNYVVVLNPDIANDRVRMNAAHELAYILFDSTDEFLSAKERLQLVDLYLNWKIPIDQFHARTEERDAFVDEWNRLTGRNDGTSDVIHYMLTQRKRGLWVNLGRAQSPAPTLADPFRGRIEEKAYIFASSLLLPGSQLREAFEGKSFLKLIQYREKFGISLAAMIYMAEESRIINSATSRMLWSEMGKKGWREHEPGYVWRDRAIAFETMLECAIQTKQMTWEDAERITGIREDDLRQRIDNALQMEAQRHRVSEPAATLKFAPKDKIPPITTEGAG